MVCWPLRSRPALAQRRGIDGSRRGVNQPRDPGVVALLGVLFYCAQMLLPLIPPAEPLRTILRLLIILLVAIVALYVIVVLLGFVGIHVPVHGF